MSNVNTTRTRTTRILIVDDHPLMRKGLAQTIADEPGMEVCGEAADINEALRKIEVLKPDIAIVDLSLGDGGNGLELIKDVMAMHPSVKILVSSMHDELLFAERVLRAGARGYVQKDEDTSTLLQALRRVNDGGVFLARPMMDRILESMTTSGELGARSPLDLLSDRELEVFEMIGRGMVTKQIAAKLDLSHKTVETYRENIKSKLRLSNATELTRSALMWILEEGS